VGLYLNPPQNALVLSVEGVYAEIAELDPGEGCWPFTDTIFIVGRIPAEELSTVLEPLQPDEVAPTTDAPSYIRQRHKAPLLYAWWD
jgi:hypothetical protein